LGIFASSSQVISTARQFEGWTTFLADRPKHSGGDAYAMINSSALARLPALCDLSNL
jgi:hypothetical protein